MPNYINMAGPGDYETPSQVNVNKSVDSQKRAMPVFSMGSKTKMPYFPKLDLVSFLKIKTHDLLFDFLY